MKDTKKTIYWNDIVELQEALNRKEKFTLSTSLKKDIASMIKNSLTENNYIIAKLLIYGKVTESILLNFLFYVSVNTKVLYELFIENPDRFCRKFMFNITPNELPNFETFYADEEVRALANEIDLENKVTELKHISHEKLQRLFPKSYKHNIMTNPFLKENTL
jgi:hypothetical protein